MNMVGDLKKYGMVWYHKIAAANILSIYRVMDKLRVQFDSRGDDKYMVWRDDGSA